MEKVDYEDLAVCKPEKSEVVWNDINFMAMFEKKHTHFVDFSVFKITDVNNFIKTKTFLHDM